VVDAAAPDAFESYLRVRNELRIYDPLLVSRTLIVAANKLDLAEARSGWELLRSRIYDEGNQSVHSVSAVTGEGLVDLLVDIRQRLEALREQDSLDETQVRVYRLPPEDKGFSVQKASDGFSVVGRSVERVLAMADMDSDEGLADLQRQLERLGVLKALEEAGVKSGDTVRAADFEMEWT
jgi:GTP-binding protein